MTNNNLFSRSSSSSFRQSSASKIDQLYEISYVPDDSRILVEHLVSLSLPSDLPRHCLAQGYTHIHFGAIRLALTFHGRKGLPAYSRIALLDTSTAGVSMPVSTASMVQEVNISIPSPVIVKDKGKGIMDEFEDEQTKKTKLQQRQERAVYEAAIRLQEQLDKEERQRIARVHKEASSFNIEE
ncbi:hypothetical protein Tco_0742550 [Tanacetum coccineum]